MDRERLMPGPVMLHRRAASVLGAASSAYDLAVLADTPSGYWKMQEIAGTTATDSSGNGRDGTYVSATVGSAGWYSTYAAEFAGTTSSYLDLADLTAWENGAGGSGLFSVECLFYLDVTGANQVLLSKGDNSNYEWALWVLTTGVLRFSVYNASASGEDQANTAAGTITKGRWYHVVAYFDKAGNTFGTIINGVAAASNSLTQTITGGTAKMQAALRDDNYGPLDGRISNVAYYPTKLSTARALAHYNALPSIPTPASYDLAVLADTPSGYWKLQELAGATAVDSSGNGRDGTYNSATLGSGGPFPAHAPGVYAAEFSGSTSSYLDLADLTAWEQGAGSAGAFSVECFFRVDNLSNHQVILSKGKGSNYEFALWVLTTGVLRFSVYNASASGEDQANTASSTIAANTWYHVIAYYDKAGTVMGTIINGVSAATGTASTTITGGSAKFLGGLREDNFAPLDGRICNVAYYPRPLNVAEAAVHYAAAI